MLFPLGRKRDRITNHSLFCVCKSDEEKKRSAKGCFCHNNPNKETSKECFWGEDLSLYLSPLAPLTKYLSHLDTGSTVGVTIDINCIFMLFWWKGLATEQNAISENLTLLHLLLSWDFSPVLLLNITPLAPSVHILPSASSLSSISQVYSIFHNIIHSEHRPYLQCKPIYFSPLLQIVLNKALRVEVV